MVSRTKVDDKFPTSQSFNTRLLNSFKKEPNLKRWWHTFIRQRRYPCKIIITETDAYY